MVPLYPYLYLHTGYFFILSPTSLKVILAFSTSCNDNAALLGLGKFRRVLMIKQSFALAKRVSG